MTSIRLIAMDLDGTLLTPPPVHITPVTVSALQQAADQGIHLVLASGRLPDDASAFLLDTGLDATIIALNGACMLDHPFGDITYTQHFNLSEAEYLYDFLMATGLTFAMFCDHDLYIRSRNPEQPEPDMVWGTYLDHFPCRTNIYRFPADSSKLLQRGVNKFILMQQDGENRLESIEKQMHRFPFPMEITSSWANNVELNVAGCNKGAALIRLCSELGISVHDVMAIGDQVNDLSMLQICGIPVAMGNATSEVTRVAKYITASNMYDGVAKAIRAYI